MWLHLQAPLLFYQLLVQLRADEGPIACNDEEALCPEAKCAFLFTSRPSPLASRSYNFYSGCYSHLLNDKNVVSEEMQRYLTAATWDDRPRGFSCANHPQSDFVLCYCTASRCNTPEMALFFRASISEIRPKYCEDTARNREDVARNREDAERNREDVARNREDAPRNRVICIISNCAFVADFTQQETTIARGCANDLVNNDAYRHLISARLSVKPNVPMWSEDNYACTETTSGRVLCECSGHDCNLQYRDTVAALLRVYWANERTADRNRFDTKQVVFLVLIGTLCGLFTCVCCFVVVLECTAKIARRLGRVEQYEQHLGRRHRRVRA